MAEKDRLDNLLVARGLAPSRARAQAIILAGKVEVGGVAARKAGDRYAVDAAITLREEDHPYVSRGALKLVKGLDSFGVDPTGLVALDIGASTGGFTDVLLQRGAARVYAVDVGYGQIDWRLRQDPRVVLLDRTNIRYLEALPPLGARDLGLGTSESAQAPPLADCATIDVSFISLRLVLPAVQRLITPEAWVVALIKPQFEAGAEQVGRGGVVRDAAVHAAVLREVLAFAADVGLAPHGLARSPITGPAGNVEFLAWLGGAGPELPVERAIAAA